VVSSCVTGARNPLEALQSVYHVCVCNSSIYAMPQKVESRYTGSPWQVCMASRAILRSKGLGVNGVRGNEWMRPSAVSLAPCTAQLVHDYGPQRSLPI